MTVPIRPGAHIMARRWVRSATDRLERTGMLGARVAGMVRERTQDHGSLLGLWKTCGCPSPNWSSGRDHALQQLITLMVGPQQ